MQSAMRARGVAAGARPYGSASPWSATLRRAAPSPRPGRRPYQRKAGNGQVVMPARPTAARAAERDKPAGGLRGAMLGIRCPS